MSEVIEGMGAVTIHVRTIEKARKFCSEVLGLKEIRYHERASRAAFAVPGTSVQLTMHVQAPGEGGRVPGTVSGIVFSHHDTVAACAEVRRRGGTIRDGSHTFTSPFAKVTPGGLPGPGR